MHHIVIIGSGLVGLTATKSLKGADAEIILLARTSHHLFQPLPHQMAIGVLSKGDIVLMAREIPKRQKNVKVFQVFVEDIDTENRIVIWRNHNDTHETPYDTLIVVASAGQSYFGKDEYVVFVPGLKTIDDVLELCARISDSFEKAEIATDPREVDKLFIFVVIGAGSIGVEIAGQTRELVSHTLEEEFRSVGPKKARILLADGAERPLPVLGEYPGDVTRRGLESLGIEVITGVLITALDHDCVELKFHDGTSKRIEFECRVWTVGAQVSEFGRVLAKRTGVELDHCGRVLVEPDLSVSGHPEIFALGDMMSAPGVPGIAQGAIQSARHAAATIIARLKGRRAPTAFSYHDKGSMAIISHFKVVVKIGNPRLSGVNAWLAWCFLHLFYTVGFKSQFTTFVHWSFSFTTSPRPQHAVTNQQLVSRLALEKPRAGSSGRFVAGEEQLRASSLRHRGT